MFSASVLMCQADKQERHPRATQRIIRRIFDVTCLLPNYSASSKGCGFNKLGYGVRCVLPEHVTDGFYTSAFCHLREISCMKQSPMKIDSLLPWFALARLLCEEMRKYLSLSSKIKCKATHLRPTWHCERLGATLLATQQALLN